MGNTVILEVAIPKCNLTIEVIDVRTGRVIQRQRIHNAVVAAGRNLIRDLMYGDGVILSHMAIGTGVTAVSDGQTALVTELCRGSLISKAKAASKLTVRYYLSTSLGNGSTLAEAGLFNAGSAGTMYARALITPTIAKTASIAVTFTWELTWATV